MALFGIQFVLSVIVATFLQKLSPYLSPARWILCNGWLIRYLHPTDEQLKAHSGKPDYPKGGKKRLASTETRSSASVNSTGNKTFTVKCSIDIHLEKAKLTESDVVPQFLYSDYKWLIDFSVSALILNLLIELCAFFFPAILSQEFNLGLFWNLLVMVFSLKILFILTAAYWRGEDSGERSICLTFGFFFFVVAMVILIIDETLLDFGLDSSYAKFSQQAAKFLEKQGFSTKEAAPIWVLKIFLALASGVVGAVMCFPGMRLAKMYIDSLYYCKETTYMVIFLHANFLMPVIVVLTWITPITKQPLVLGNWHANKQQKVLEPVLSDRAFSIARLGLVLAFCLLRLSLTWVHMQSYLNIAQERMENLKRETGRITNVDLKRKVAGVFYYLSAATLQYLAPTVLIFFTTLVLKTLETTDWSSIPTQSQIDYSKLISNSTLEAASDVRGLLIPELFKGIFSYMLCWFCSSWFITSVFGVVYIKMIKV